MTKKHKVIIDPMAKLDMKEILFFVAVNDNVQSANRLLDALEETCNKLEKFPVRGHTLPELRQTGIKSYLEIHYKPCRIIYEIDDNVIYIHAAIDGRRNIQEILSSRLLR